MDGVKFVAKMLCPWGPCPWAPVPGRRVPGGRVPGGLVVVTSLSMVVGDEDCGALVTHLDRPSLSDQTENERAEGDQSQDDDQQVGHDFELFP
ncbi:hypothetical protein Poly21_25340 [Allorhodopirellula heiligendammensis]|uniref:Uncharacterized protein n=1 Tax=Allorhodopirellula heiligendammensis TaxID=2714739 RepID=A0A5C6BXD1_9BACT|nr:hypothetical protein Poly21_25340 [Allorhodopirellula heiligendammensis]